MENFDLCYKNIARVGLTKVSSFKKIIQDIPDNYALATNNLGNILILAPAREGKFKIDSFIELMNLSYYDGTNLVDCELYQYYE